MKSHNINTYRQGVRSTLETDLHFNLMVLHKVPLFGAGGRFAETGGTTLDDAELHRKGPLLWITSRFNAASAAYISREEY